MNKILLATILLSLVLIAGYAGNQTPVSAERDDTNQFMVGIFRADGAVIPFAQYGNGGWWNPWPRPRDIAESIYAEGTEVVHHSLTDLPEPWFKQCGKTPTTWFFSPSDGTATLVRATKVFQVSAHSGSNWALLTDFPRQSSEDPLHDILGVAVNVNQKIEPAIEINTASTEANEISSFVKQIFTGIETEEIDRMRAETPPAITNLPLMFSLSKEERAKIEVSLTRLYRSNSVVNGEHIYYFEAEKYYQRPTTSRNPGCDDISALQGWISADAKGGIGLMENLLVFTDCDRKGPSTMIPLGMMRLKDRTFLFVIEHGWEDASYTILELDTSGLHRVLETVGG